MSNLFGIPAGSRNFNTSGLGIVQFGDVAAFGGTDFGFTDKTIDFEYNKNFNIITAGRPQVQVNQILDEITSMFSFGSIQCSPATFQKILGGDPTYNIDASPVTLTAAPFTFAPWPQDPNLNAIYVGGPITTFTSVKDVTNATTYVNANGATGQADYFVDAAGGWIVLVPGGAITATQTVHGNLIITPPASICLPLGNYLSTALQSITFTHLRPNGDSTVQYIPQAMADGKLKLNYKAKGDAGTGMTVRGTWRGVYLSTFNDPSGNLAPLGYVQCQTTQGAS